MRKVGTGTAGTFRYTLLVEQSKYICCETALRNIIVLTIREWWALKVLEPTVISFPGHYDAEMDGLVCGNEVRLTIAIYRYPAYGEDDSSSQNEEWLGGVYRNLLRGISISLCGGNLLSNTVKYGLFCQFSFVQTGGMAMTKADESFKH